MMIITISYMTALLLRHTSCACDSKQRHAAVSARPARLPLPFSPPLVASPPAPRLSDVVSTNNYGLELLNQSSIYEEESEEEEEEMAHSYEEESEEEEEKSEARVQKPEIEGNSPSPLNYIIVQYMNRFCLI